jgi:hypothetical protein
LAHRPHPSPNNNTHHGEQQQQQQQQQQQADSAPPHPQLGTICNDWQPNNRGIGGIANPFDAIIDLDHSQPPDRLWNFLEDEELDNRHLPQNLDDDIDAIWKWGGVISKRSARHRLRE